MPNALTHASSLYLQQHAENPVNWLPWGEAAFQKAQSEQKLIFLSIGYSTCHWCHVMERESFEDQDVADVLNASYISIKVDREERPDVDASYMAFLQALTGSGGWPMSLWLTPDGAPLTGGTYYPKQSTGGRQGFIELCQEVAQLWKEDPQPFLERGQKIAQTLQQRADQTHVRDVNLNVPKDKLVGSLFEQYDPNYGGFGQSPKFPRPPLLHFLGYLSSYGDTESQRELCTRMYRQTLKRMQRGGIMDQLAGGFHRYSVDTYWHVPHFEKMLYDQGLLLQTYTRAWLITKDPSFQQTAQQLRDYLLDELRDSQGAFHAGEDADSLSEVGEMEEGAYWTWRDSELDVLISDTKERNIIRSYYDIKEKGNARPESDPHGELTQRNTLWRPQSDQAFCESHHLRADELKDILRRAKATLKSHREVRHKPQRDDKILIAWNAYVIEGLLFYSTTFCCNESYRAAREALEFIRDFMYPEKHLVRAWRRGNSTEKAYAQDYAALISALQRAYQTDANKEWLEWAHELQATMDEDFWDEERGGYVIASMKNQNNLLVMVEDFDGPEPSTNSLAASNLWYWNIMGYEKDNGHTGTAQKLELIQKRTSGALMENPQALPAYLTTSLMEQRGWCKVTCSLESARALREYDLPHVFFHYKEEVGDSASTYTVCRGHSCYEPVESLEDVLKLLR